MKSRKTITEKVKFNEARENIFEGNTTKGRKIEG
jgi:hypothetical protein